MSSFLSGKKPNPLEIKRIKSYHSCVSNFYEEVFLVNKGELVAQIAEKAEIKKKEAELVVDAWMTSVKEALVKGEKVQVIGFGTFEVRDRAARVGHNPQTGKEIKMAAAKNPAFKPGKALKDAVNASKKKK